MSSRYLFYFPRPSKIPAVQTFRGVRRESTPLGILAFNQFYFLSPKRNSCLCSNPALLKVWGEVCRGRDLGAEAGRWLSRVILGEAEGNLRLVQHAAGASSRPNKKEDLFLSPLGRSERQGCYFRIYKPTGVARIFQGRLFLSMWGEIAGNEFFYEIFSLSRMKFFLCDSGTADLYCQTICLHFLVQGPALLC